MTGTNVSQDQKSGRSMCPAFRNVRTLSTLAYGVDVAFFEEIGDLEKILMRREFDFEPGWLFFGL